MAAVTALAEMNPPAAPLTSRPRREPRTRTPTYPTQPIPVIATTSNQIRNGFRTWYGPIPRFGNRGSTTNATIANFTASATSTSVTPSFSRWWTRPFDMSSTTSTTATQVASAGRDSVIDPRRYVARPASTVVDPWFAFIDRHDPAAINTAAAPRPTATVLVETRRASDPASASTVNVRIPPKWSGTSRWLRSRSAPIIAPMAIATRMGWRSVHISRQTDRRDDRIRPSSRGTGNGSVTAADGWVRCHGRLDAVDQLLLLGRGQLRVTM